MQFTQVLVSLALAGSIQAKFHNTTSGAAVSNSTAGGAGASNSTAGGAGASNSTSGGSGSSNAGVVANANVYGGAALAAAAIALLY
ncbi:hypothetical protein PVL30_004695 [Lodderomyces elongisporus]|uniref:Uncharacterized protein n=1 Tax=Lodderomyces elongisporus (strain ATCC 11503 / CBS 2605 / JCM 1781 / NBRC 1676 / NRRL YB-4239) TaxID=379508 RepID=A5E2N4_LODEL|nr:uncharacterized protein PVL30_004695 [Lodderomyces elongisporus]EDK45692.1 predicted protein [Lodderomyces elongisporus NRRL YB-4239]WLF80902.1 hypothetical protein PVL30_004695 [Lodderomyces elongisporus]